MASRSGEEFNNHIKRASEAFESGNYNVARYWYKKALDLRPDDNDTKEKLNELQNKMSE